jgi:hypothetical protein
MLEAAVQKHSLPVDMIVLIITIIIVKVSVHRLGDWGSIPGRGK